VFLLLLEVLYTSRQLYIEQVDLLGVLQRNSRGESMICKDSRANQTVDEDVHTCDIYYRTWRYKTLQEFWLADLAFRTKNGTETENPARAYGTVGDRINLM